MPSRQRLCIAKQIYIFLRCLFFEKKSRDDQLSVSDTLTNLPTKKDFVLGFMPKQPTLFVQLILYTNKPHTTHMVRCHVHTISLSICMPQHKPRKFLVRTTIPHRTDFSSSKRTSFSFRSWVICKIILNSLTKEGESLSSVNFLVSCLEIQLGYLDS